MFFRPKFYYNTEGGNGGGGNDNLEKDTEIIDKKETEQPLADAEKKEIPQQTFSDEELKGFGFNSKEELRNFLAKQKEDNLSPEEKQKKENIDKANFLKFSAENNLLKVEDYNQYETLKAKSDTDLVYENFLKDYKEDHPEITDEKELEEAAKEDFDFEYKQKPGETEAAKKKGEAKIAREAKELRSPVESKVTAAQEQFKQNNNIRETYPKFEKFVDEAIIRNTPDKTVLYKAKDGEEEINIEIELTAKDRESIAKDFKTPKTFGLFTTAKPEEIQTAIDKKIQGWIRLNKFEEVAAKSFETGVGIGTKKSSTTGAENPFPLTKTPLTQNIGEKTLAESNAEMSKARQRYR